MNEGTLTHTFFLKLSCASHPIGGFKFIPFQLFQGEAFILFAPQELFRSRAVRSQTRASTSVWQSTGLGRDIQLQPISTSEVRPPAGPPAYSWELTWRLDSHHSAEAAKCVRSPTVAAVICLPDMYLPRLQASLAWVTSLQRVGTLVLTHRVWLNFCLCFWERDDCVWRPVSQCP